MTKSKPQEELECEISPSELARRLGVHRLTVSRWRREGMPAQVYGTKLVRFRMSEALTWLKSRGGPSF